ncbi:Urb2/Npa2 family-domain-containing protein [Dichomitus squalens]|uniref:Urb2/Npa2 family-domain-containing protein n=1 Tax=Dichomitus squalens TaxID=114155 RepID=A0A4Q9QB65_9APHY|nr:Urb2/Npa2 family-domain-containing protein [Dichomitus squalens]
MRGLQNAQDFIRALKAPSDPPHEGGPLKIDIARQAWEDSLLYVPNKAEAISDWLLSRLLKDRSRERSENPVFDTRYWLLLADVLACSSPAREGDPSTRTSRPWLVPLLNRVPVAPIILSYFELLSESDSIDFEQYKLVAWCVSVLWPLAVPKFSPETLLECFGAVLQLGVSSMLSALDGSPGTLQELDHANALSVIVSSYRTSLASSAAKRKQINTLFLQKHLPFWLQLVPADGHGQALLSDVYDAGIETMFGLEVVKQMTDSKYDTALLEALEDASIQSPAVVPCSIPRLFASYVRSVKRHKSALFGQGSSRAPGHILEQVQAASMVFYGTCNTLARKSADDASWQCLVSLLEVVERENVLSVEDEEAHTLLRGDGDLAVEALAVAWDESHASRTDCALKILATLARIDYDLTSAAFAVIYPRLLAVPGSISSALQYLRLLLEYESKTRTLPSAIEHVSEAFSVQHLKRISDSPHTAYQLASAGPLTSLPFLDELSRAVHGFLTPGQVLDTIAYVARTLKDAYGRLVERDARVSAVRGDGPRKKRRKSNAPSSEDGSESEYHAVSFDLIARTMIVVLRSLPLHSLTDDARAEAERSVQDLYHAVASPALAQGLGGPSQLVSRSWQIVVTGALRLHYGLARAPALQLELRLEDELPSAMLQCVPSPDVIPDLVVELLRTMLHQCSLGFLQPEAVLDRLLDYLEMHVAGDTASWTGRVHALHGHDTGGVAVLHLLVDRWLPDFDTWATSKQLERLAAILVNAGRLPHVSQSPIGLSVQTVLSRLLRDAQFWELLTFRDAFISELVEHTAPMAGVDLPDLLSRLAADTTRPSADVVSQIAWAYKVLLLIPAEYLPRATHIEFLKRGFAADVTVYLTLRYAKSWLSEQDLLVIRKVLRRTIDHLGLIENVISKEFMGYLLEHGINGEAVNDASRDLRLATMNLVDMYQGSLVRLAKKGKADSVVELAHRYAEAFDSADAKINFEASSLLIDSLVQSASPSELPAPCIDSLRNLHKSMLNYSLPRLGLGSDDYTIPLDRSLLDIWFHSRILGRWLDVDDVRIPVIGRQLSRRLLSPVGSKENISSLGSVVLSILLGELQDAATLEVREGLEFMVVAYLAFARTASPSDITGLESQLASACKTLSTDTFSSLLDLVYDGLPLHKGLSSPDVARLIRLSSILLRDAPEGTAKICQSHTTQCLNLFADDEQFTTDPCLRGEVLDFLARQCGDRPASIRTADLSSLWSILRALLSGSTAHEQSTDSTVFHGIVNVLNALVRLRRDLILNTLPHLGFVLRQLVACLRSLRPQLGGKQSRLVMDTLPRWISPSGPLSGQESKALARLLTTLTTKTIVRTHGAAADSQKPESLTRAFSKHAAYVLTAYVEAVNEPLCLVSSGIRKELQPGLFALCEMLGEHTRDAMMVSALDVGGKATMKVLWREYEKQRYVGKG